MPTGKKKSVPFRNGRVNEEISRELTEILRTVKDPRVSGSFISIISVDTTADLKYCKVYFSVYGSDTKEVAKGIKSASGYIRHELSQRLNLRATPELTFIADNSIEHGAHISAIIESLGKETKTETEN